MPMRLDVMLHMRRSARAGAARRIGVRPAKSAGTARSKRLARKGGVEVMNVGSRRSGAMGAPRPGLAHHRWRDQRVGPRARRYVIRTPADGVGGGFSGIGNADRLKRHESGGRTMAHVADHLSFDTFANLERAVTERCLVLDSDQLKPGTNFHWWPKPIIPA